MLNKILNLNHHIFSFFFFISGYFSSSALQNFITGLKIFPIPDEIELLFFLNSFSSCSRFTLYSFKALILVCCLSNRFWTFSSVINFSCNTSQLSGKFFPFGFFSIIIWSISFNLFTIFSTSPNLLASNLTRF
jgi:hypothetical protein